MLRINYNIIKSVFFIFIWFICTLCLVTFYFKYFHIFCSYIDSLHPCALFNYSDIFILDYSLYYSPLWTLTPPLSGSTKSSDPMDSTIGKKIISNYESNLTAQLAKNGINLPLKYTIIGKNATLDLINMINSLEENNNKSSNSTLKDTNKLLLDFLISNTGIVYKFNFELTYPQIKLLQEFEVNLSFIKEISTSKNIIELNESGVYCFKHLPTGYIGIGSSINCLFRLRDHISSFNGHRSETFLHKWVNSNGGISTVHWSPILTYPNLYLEWLLKYPEIKLNSPAGWFKLIASIYYVPWSCFRASIS